MSVYFCFKIPPLKTKEQIENFFAQSLHFVFLVSDNRLQLLIIFIRMVKIDLKYKHFMIILLQINENHIFIYNFNKKVFLLYANSEKIDFFQYKRLSLTRLLAIILIRVIRAAYIIKIYHILTN